MRIASLVLIAFLGLSPTSWAADLDGVVTAESGASPLAGIEISLYAPVGGGWSLADFTSTDSEGAYAFPGIDDGTYRLLFLDRSRAYAFEYSGNATTLDTAADIAVSGSTTYDATLSDAGRIGGSLADPDGMAVASGFVAIYPDAIPLGDVLFIQQLPPGSTAYGVGGLPTGRYIARFSGQVGGQSHLEYFDNTPDAAFATPIDVSAGQMTGVDVVLGEVSGLDIDGTVTDGNGAPLEGIEVSIYRWTGLAWEYQQFVETPAKGTYAFTDLDPGDYRVLFRDWSGAHAFQYWPDAATLDDGQTVVLDDSSQTANATMQAAGRISGTLSDPAGRPLFNPLIAIFGAWDPDQVLFVQQPAGTDYDIGGLPTGDYLVRFTGQQSNNRSYLEFYDDALDRQSAAPVSVHVGDTTGQIDAVMGLGPGGTIRGRLRDRYGEKLDIGRVSALNWNDGQWVEVSSVQAIYQDDDFDYLLDVPAGEYRLRFEGGSFLAPNGLLESEFYADAQTVDTAAPVSVQTGDDIDGIDVRLGTFSTGSLSGTVTDVDGGPAPGIEVLVFDRSLSLLSDQIETTDAGGAYTVSGLWPEEYFVRFYDPAGGLQNAWFDNALSPSAAQRVPVAEPVTGIDAILEPASAAAPGSIAGRVTDSQSQPLAEIIVRAYQAPCDFSNETPVCDIVARTESASDGSYRLRDLATGDYLVQFVSQDGDYLTRFFPAADSLETATPVAVSAPAATTDIDQSLPLAGAITGVVSNAFGDPFDLLTVSAYRLVNGEYAFERATFERDDTEYRITRLPTGTYRVGFSGGGFTGNRVREFFDDAPDLASATDVPVTAGSDTEWIDAILGPIPGGAISGTVTDDSGQAAVGITVKLYDQEFLDDQTLTDASGQYEFSPLDSGLYFVQFEDSGGTLPGEYYRDVATFDRATPILIEDAPITGIDAVLDGPLSSIGGGLISGRVSDAEGNPLEGIRVSCQPVDPDAFDGLPCSGTTDPSGHFEIGGRLLAGDYRVQFNDPLGVYASEFFDDRIFRTDADPVAVVPGGETIDTDADLALGASIEGAVTRNDGGFYPITSVSLLRREPVSGNWLFVAGSTRLDDGNYRIDGVPAGTYRVRFRGSSLSNIQNSDIEFYDDSAVVADGVDVVLTAGQVTSGIDAVLGDLDEDGQAANADFDESIAGWAISNANAALFGQEDIHASPESGSLMISADESVAVSQCLAVDGARILEASAFLRSAATANVEIRLHAHDQPACSGTALTESLVGAGPTQATWTELKGQLTTPAATRTVRIELSVSAGPTPVHADGIDLRLVQPTSTIFASSFE